MSSEGSGLWDDGDGPVKKLKSFLTNRGTSRNVTDPILPSEVGRDIPPSAARTFGTPSWTSEMQYSIVAKNRHNQGSKPT